MAKAPFNGVDRTGKGKIKTIITEAQTKSGSTAIVGPVRLSFLNAFKPRMNEDRGREMYSAALLIDREDGDLLDFLEERIDHACKTKFGKVLPKFVSCLMDGDEETDKEGDAKAPGCMYISTLAELDQKPLLFGPDGAELEPSEYVKWNSGDWGYVKLDFFGYDTRSNRGVSTRLKAVQFCAKDESFGGAGAQDPDKVKSEFGGVEGVDEKYQKAQDSDADERSSRRRERSSRDGSDEKPRRHYLD